MTTSAGAEGVLGGELGGELGGGGGPDGGGGGNVRPLVEVQNVGSDCHKFYSYL